MTGRLPVVALTSGEPAGIGPELCAMLAGTAPEARVVVLGDADLLSERSACVHLPGRAAQPYRTYARNADAAVCPGTLEVLHIPVVRRSIAGRLDVANAPYVLALLDRAIEGCRSGEFDAMVTAPVHKGVINDAGIGFTGHTEYLEQVTRTPSVVMMLVGGNMRVALATTHLPLHAVSRAITREGLAASLRVIDQDLRLRFGIARPRILVAGLNPHSGESGHLGREEIDVIAPVVEALIAGGMDLEGPLPADTLFVPERLAKADCVLAMYHDQGLPVLKYASFGAGVNVTLGLPFVRTSVDHGTALDLAGSGKADGGSLVEAVRLAITLAAGNQV